MHLLSGYEDQRGYRQLLEKEFAVCDLSLLQALLLTAQGFGSRFTTLDSNCHRRQLTGIDSHHDILVPHRLQVDHRGSQVLVSHPILQSLYVANVIL